MTMMNPTQNQHFVTQAEQRLNSINPNAKENDQRIYAFSLVDRDPPKIQLAKGKGHKINKTLSVNDLFSFDVLDKTNRYNFEQLFQPCEDDITRYTCEFFDKIEQSNESVNDEMFRILRLKLLNIIRNPYLIKMTLNIFRPFINVHPTNPDLYREYERVVFGNKPHQSYLCNLFGITEDQYNDWLRCIFLLLIRVDDENLTSFDKVVANLFNNGNLHTMISLYTYDNETCLLSDNGFVNCSDNPNRMVMAFNLRSRAFVQYAFSDIDAFIDERVGDIPSRYREGVEQYKSGPKNVTISRHRNDLKSLQGYNMNAVLQCHSHVYNSAKKCHGVEVV